MVIDKEFLEQEIKQAEKVVAKHHEAMLHAQGCVSILRQLLGVIEEPECPPEIPSDT